MCFNIYQQDCFSNDTDRFQFLSLLTGLLGRVEQQGATCRVLGVGRLWSASRRH